MNSKFDSYGMTSEAVKVQKQFNLKFSDVTRELKSTEAENRVSLCEHFKKLRNLDEYILNRQNITFEYKKSIAKPQVGITIVNP